MKSTTKGSPIASKASTESKSPTVLPTPTPSAVDVKQLRESIKTLGAKGSQDVSAVRGAFTAGTAPLQTASSSSVADFVSRFGTDAASSAVIRSTSQLGVKSSVVGTIVTAPRPELDFVEVGDDRSFGVLDSFYTRIVASLSVEDAKRVDYIRILRANGGPSKNAVKPSVSAMIDSMPIGAKTKSAEYISNTAFRVSDVGVGNKLTDFVTDDTFTKQRAVVTSGTLNSLPPVLNTNRRTAPSALISIDNADRSVLENVKFYVNQRTMSPNQQLSQPLVVGKRQGINVLQGSVVGGRSTTVEVSNAAGFYEVSRIPVVNSRTIGAFVEIEYFDPSVVYGATYTYYVVAVTKDGLEGPRSRLVKVDIVRLRPPASPVVSYGVSAGRPRFAMQCSGTFLDHIEVFRKGGNVPESVRVLSTRESMIADRDSIETDSGFYHIIDVGLGANRSAVYVDLNVAGGQELEYRFYTVDSFGLKSSTPFSCSIAIPNHGDSIPLPKPSITAEQAPGGRVVNISVHCDDPRIRSFVIGRRELTTVEHAYRQPSTPDWFDTGIPSSAKRARSRSGPILNQFSPKAWSGVFTAISGAASFQDLSVEFDRRYQYSVYAVDLRGNNSSRIPSVPIFVSVKPVSDPPVNLTGTVLIDPNDGNPTGVHLTWNVGTLDFSPNDLIGDQDVLSATSKRTVYQVERRLVGTFEWNAMPATTSSYFVDHVTLDQAPKFRPTYAEPNAVYDYRVIAMQSGAFLSTYTDHIRTIVAPGIEPPDVIWLRSTPTSIRPIHVVVSWQYDGKFVDGWEIERAVTNKIFGSKVFSMDSVEARSLQYNRVAEITRESSRASGISADLTVDPKVFVGNRYFIDQDIDLANSYFYRVRAFDAAGRLSDWSYAGIALTDSPHDRKFLSALSDDEKSSLALDPRPISKWRNG